MSNMTMEQAGRAAMRPDRTGREPPAWVYLAPTLLLIGALVVVPLGYAAYLSVSSVQGNIFTNAGFVGLDNYLKALQSPAFGASALRTLYFAAVSMLIQFPLGLAVALLLNERFFGRTVVRALVLIPWALPTIVSGVLWSWILQANYGALNGLLLQFGLVDRPVLWLGSPWLAMNMVIVADTWKVLPFYATLLLAGLQTISPDIYEAAAIDGANAWQRFWTITLPSLIPVILILIVLRTVDTFRAFDIIYQITQGGPAGGTTVVAYHAYTTSFLQLQFGQGAAISFLIAAAVVGLAAIYMRVLNRAA